LVEILAVSHDSGRSEDISLPSCHCKALGAQFLAFISVKAELIVSKTQRWCHLLLLANTSDTAKNQLILASQVQSEKDGMTYLMHQVFLLSRQ
jgi:hypothetical protein